MTPNQPPTAQNRRALALAGVHLRAHIHEFAQQCTSLIQQNVAAYAPSTSGNRQKVIEDLTTFAALQFCALLENRAVDPKLRPTAQRLAARAATGGESVESFISALNFARVLGCRFIDSLASAGHIDPALRASLHAAVGQFIGALIDDVQQGYESAAESIRRSPAMTRRTLALALFNGAWDERCCQLAEILGWKVPDRFLIVSLAATDRNLLNLTDHEHLYIVAGDTFTFACDVQSAATIRDKATSGGLVAATYTVVPSLRDVPGGAKETQTLLALAHQSVGAVGPGLLDCRDYTQLIWLANAPTQREALMARMLSPLDGYKPEFRRRLLETLRLYLLTRDSAPRLAAALGTHPQTVRARLRVLNETLGDLMQDPEQSMTLLLLLNSDRTTRAA